MQLRMIRFHPDGTSTRQDGIDSGQLAEAGRPGDLLWLDAAGEPDATLQWLAGQFGLESGTLTEYDDPVDRARIDYFSGYVQLGLHGLIGTRDDPGVRVRPFFVICRPGLMLTLHRLPVEPLDFLFEASPRAATSIGRRGLGHLLYMLLDRMIDNSMVLARKYEQQLNSLEDRAVARDCDDGLLQSLSDVRDEVLRLWRTLVALREVMIELCEEDFDFIQPESARYLELVRDHGRSALELVEILRGMVGEVRETYRTTLSLRSTEAMQYLTVFAGIMIPLTLIVGIYGMNVPLWPDPENPATFWGIIGFMVLLSLGLLWYFRRQRWV